jgi:hypothetical protein
MEQINEDEISEQDAPCVLKVLETIRQIMVDNNLPTTEADEKIATIEKKFGIKYELGKLSYEEMVKIYNGLEYNGDGVVINLP